MHALPWWHRIHSNLRCLYECDIWNSRRMHSTVASNAIFSQRTHAEEENGQRASERASERQKNANKLFGIRQPPRRWPCTTVACPSHNRGIKLHTDLCTDKWLLAVVRHSLSLLSLLLDPNACSERFIFPLKKKERTRTAHRIAFFLFETFNILLLYNTHTHTH